MWGVIKVKIVLKLLLFMIDVEILFIDGKVFCIIFIIIITTLYQWIYKESKYVAAI